MLPPALRMAQALFNEFKKAPLKTLSKLLPTCQCGEKTIAACSRCSLPVCFRHGYLCIEARDALCIPCVEEMRTGAAELSQED